MEFYSRTQPDLISPLFKNSMNSIKVCAGNNNISNTSISSTIVTRFGEFYNSYIDNNLIIVVVIIIVAMLLIYRYYNRDEIKKESRYKNISNKEEEILNMLNDVIKDDDDEENREDREDRENRENREDDNLVSPLNDLNVKSQKLIPQFNNLEVKHDTLWNGYLNPTYSYQGDPSYVMAQQPVIFHPAPVSYPPDPNRVVYNNSSFINNLDGDYYKNYNTANNNLNTNDKYVDTTSVNNYNGTYNSYLNAQDTTLVNPIGLPVDFNTTTGNFVGQMTDLNKQNILDYNAILDNTNKDLLNSRVYNNGIPKVEPPYSDV